MPELRTSPRRYAADEGDNCRKTTTTPDGGITRRQAIPKHHKENRMETLIIRLMTLSGSDVAKDGDRSTEHRFDFASVAGSAVG
jgi:hypothetical protein